MEIPHIPLEQLSIAAANVCCFDSHFRCKSIECRYLKKLVLEPAKAPVLATAKERVQAVVKALELVQGAVPGQV